MQFTSVYRTKVHVKPGNKNFLVIRWKSDKLIFDMPIEFQSGPVPGFFSVLGLKTLFNFTGTLTDLLLF